jgi:hypothetical protein
MKLVFLALLSAVLLLPTPARGARYDEIKMLCAVNRERADEGLPPLGYDGDLTQAARRHSRDQANMSNMDHDGSDGSSPSERVSDAGYDWTGTGENIAYGYADQEECLEKWLKSPGHRENIMGDYTHLGSAVSYDGDTPYYTQEFGNDGKKHHFPRCPSGRGGYEDDNDDEGDEEDDSDHRRPRRHRTAPYKPRPTYHHNDDDDDDDDGHDGHDDDRRHRPRRRRRRHHRRPCPRKRRRQRPHSDSDY